jgi:hypothetical protein
MFPRVDIVHPDISILAGRNPLRIFSYSTHLYKWSLVTHGAFEGFAMFPRVDIVHSDISILAGRNDVFLSAVYLHVIQGGLACHYLVPIELRNGGWLVGLKEKDFGNKDRNKNSWRK